MADLAYLPIKVTRGRLYEQVTSQLRALIAGGGLKPGDRLPAERVLAEQLGVSRIVIREAMKVLEEQGLVKVQVGSGTYVALMEADVVTDAIGRYIQQYASSFEHLSEMRRILEVEVAGLAAERATAEDVARMEQIVESMANAVKGLQTGLSDLETFVRVDLAFHTALGEATQNPLLPVLLEPFTDLLAAYRRRASALPGGPSDALRFHRAILEQVKARNAPACRTLMLEHLQEAAELVARAQAPEASTEPEPTTA
jgi:GntR family transcriptional regulator, transcriptional repressor for pyruvate dehydrogenase complex